jgi:hypothetical protein
VVAEHDLVGTPTLPQVLETERRARERARVLTAKGTS